MLNALFTSQASTATVTKQIGQNISHQTAQFVTIALRAHATSLNSVYLRRHTIHIRHPQNQFLVI